MNRLADIFDVYYGLNLELNALEKDDKGINFVSRTRQNNGVSAKVKIINDISPIPAGTISVAAGGASVVESFLQLSPYYSGRDLYYLKPKIPITNQVKLYYCICIKMNRYRFSYGRQANSTLEELQVPSLKEVPNWVKDFPIESYAKQMIQKICISPSEEIEKTGKGEVRLDKLFETKNGISSSEVERFTNKLDESWVPYIRPSYKQETSIDGYVSKDKVPEKYIFPEGTLYVSTDGQGSHTHAYVSVFEFVPNSNVSILIPKKEMSLLEKLYYAKCITNNRYRFAYARKPKGDRLKSIYIPESPPDYVKKYDLGNILSEFNEVIEKLWGKAKQGTLSI